jgi:hypothetical protein
MSTLDNIVEIHEDDKPHTGPVDNPLIVRDLLIERERLERKITLTKDTARMIAEGYAERVQKAEDRISEIRNMISLYVEQNGPVSFPDVGGAHLRTTRERVTIQDTAAFSEWAREKGEVFERPVFDRPAAQEWALQMLHADGQLPDGCEYEAEGTGLTVRGPS